MSQRSFFQHARDHTDEWAAYVRALQRLGSARCEEQKALDAFVDAREQLARAVERDESQCMFDGFLWAMLCLGAVTIIVIIAANCER